MHIHRGVLFLFLFSVFQFFQFFALLFCGVLPAAAVSYHGDVDKGEMRAPDDVGGGTTEDIDNLRRKFEEDEKKKKEEE